ncbi:CPBP family intramembrane glutamic endopeptidase [Alkalicoccobacillus porphyridii]|uniref:CPBP family intramembrane metalloprotease n=1 Tax=Alkalicoccobacillus porphyridii TaxID=2597270 RepID=A0A554A1D2_9BACI|nr:type II CAAX endopeptidase family protein [Alkalicoccobacillus porphyridii]TSB47512.1 CPBP family intramembrane metalloprotease [Alkalicoccobacillus porphyridii]
MNNQSKGHNPTNEIRPGWLEIIVLGIVYFIVVVVVSRIILHMFSSDITLVGLSLSALSAFAGLAAFAAAYLIRIRSGAAFGIRKTTWKWLLISIGIGLAVFLLNRGLLILLYIWGGDLNTQDAYQAASSSGVLIFSIQLLFIGILTPLGEEFAFRGVLTNALLRYGPWIGIGVSSLIFALAHGINEILPIAFITGLAAGYLYYRTKSVWPAVIVHGMNNLLGTIVAFISSYFI